MTLNGATADTVKLAEVPVRLGLLWVAVSVVVCTSTNVIDAVPTPAVKVTVAGYVGAVELGLGLCAGPEKVMVLTPVKPTTVLP